MSETTEQAERERLIAKYMAYAKNIAGQIAPGLPIELDDAVQLAYTGLVEAAVRFDFDKYDPTLGDLDNHFKSFAYLRIRGAVIDEVRRMSFVSRRGVEQGVHIQMTSLDALHESDDGMMPAIQLADTIIDSDLVIDFEDAMHSLSSREAKVVMALAAGGRGRELAEEFGITESRVSQIAAEAREKLTKEMA